MVDLNSSFMQKNADTCGSFTSVLSICAAISATFALSSRVTTEGSSIGEKLMAIFPVYSGQLLLLALLLIAFLAVFKRTRPNVAITVLSTILSLCIVIGRSFDFSGNLSFVKSGFLYMLVSFVCWLGFAFLIYAVISIGYQVLDRICKKRCLGLQGDATTVEQSHPFLLPFFIILVCWLPYIIALFPGLTCYDFIVQLQQFYGAREPSNHHPWFMTLVFGGLYHIGFSLGGSSNAGLFAVALMQILTSAATGANIVFWQHRLGCPRLVSRLTIAFFALWPLFPIYSMWCTKDILSALLMVNFLMQVVLKVLAVRSNVLSPHMYYRWPCIALTAVLCSLSRSNCAYIVVPTLLAVIFFIGKRSQRRIAIGVMLSVAIAFVGWSYVLLPQANIEKGNVREALSLPLLQVAKCVALHEDSISQEEQKTIQDACSTSIDELGQLYSHRTADFVKFKFNFEGDELREWLKTYIDLGIRYPGDYVYVFLETNYGYWYPAPPDGYVGLNSEINPITNNMIPSDLLNYMGTKEVHLEHVLYDLSPAFPNARECLRSVVETANNLPFTWIVFAPAGYIWTCVILFVYIGLRKKPGLLLIVPLGLLFLVCLISPLNGSIRYALPFVYTLPFILGCATSTLLDEY